MENQSLKFKGQLPDEHFLAFYRKHWVVIVPLFLYGAAFLALLIILLIYIRPIHDFLMENPLMQAVYFLIFLLFNIFTHYFFIRLLNYFVDIAIVTDRRVIDHQKSLFFKDKMEMIDLKAIQDITIDRAGLMPSIFKYGDIKIIIASSLVTKIFSYVPQVKFYFRTICEQCLKYRPRRFKED